MKVLVVGSGGREHALAWRLAQDESVAEVFVYPGNPGMKKTAKLGLIDEVVTFDRAVEIVKRNAIELVVIGPERYLFEGWVDQFKKLGIAAYGPSQRAAFLEHSKIESKIFMRENAIETAPFEVVQNLESAIVAIDAHPEWAGYVLKLSGPALGKGVIVTHSAAEAKAAAQDFFKHRPPGIEEGMIIEAAVRGREVSLFYVCHGESFCFLASACDHKRLDDHDQGPNTGGMGAYSPCEWIDQKFLADAEDRFVKPTLAGMKRRGTPFTGTLFLGLMVNSEATSLLEYNVRFGDPETQTFLPLLSGDFATLLLAAAKGSSSFTQTKTQNDGRRALHVVKAAKGYPGLFGTAIESDQEVLGTQMRTQASELPGAITESAGTAAAHWFFAGVKEKDSKLFTSGGRVCGITAVGKTLKEARSAAYGRIEEVSFSGEHYRRDIGAKA